LHPAHLLVINAALSLAGDSLTFLLAPLLEAALAETFATDPDKRILSYIQQQSSNFWHQPEVSEIGT